ncbi:unnamed protein product [Adineta ricciae]|uniref:Uncharacterized protein n=1 Tax=Adineta ricciae TaxID=249248 RepID=A0A814MJP7_ADIRI|nr:unnamed protein product [Adineta ricciae]CAF1363529.1 unnamed protein product [Adineta ricciae]
MICSSRRRCVVNDFNRDSHPDVVIGNSGTDSINVFLGIEKFSFTNQTTYSTGPVSSPYSVTIDYFNNGRKLDIIVVNYNDNNFGLLLGHDNEIFDNVMLEVLEYGSHLFFFIVLADYSNNGKMDFYIAKKGIDSLTIYLQTS